MSGNLKVELFFSVWTIRKALTQATGERLRAYTVSSYPAR